MFGSELNSAFAPFNSDTETISPFLQEGAYDPQTGQAINRSSHEIVHKSTPISQVHQHSGGEQLPIPKPSNLVPTNSTNNTQDPRIAVLVNELRKQQKLTASLQQQTGYIDKLFAKKKDMLKIFQLSLIIVLAMSIHFIIDYYTRNYLKNNDLTFERELIIRMLYPVSIIFILWNMKAFIK